MSAICSKSSPVRCDCPGGITLLGVGPIQLLFASSIAGGIATPITLAVLMVTARDAQVMKEHRIGRGLMWGG